MYISRKIKPIEISLIEENSLGFKNAQIAL